MAKETDHHSGTQKVLQFLRAETPWLIPPRVIIRDPKAGIQPPHDFANSKSTKNTQQFTCYKSRITYSGPP